MNDLAQPVTATDEFSDLLADLRQLSKGMLLAFRLAVGQRLLDRFFAGQISAYRDRNPEKDAAFARFTQTCRQELADLGLSPSVARQCIVAHVTWQLLPPSVRDQLLLSHVVELGRVGDPTARARLAMDTTLNRWNVEQLKDAIDRDAAGQYYDTDPTTPGTQPPPAKPEAARLPQPGRLVTQLHKAAADLGEWQTAWRSVDASKLRGGQKVKLAGALQALKAKVAELEAELAEAPDVGEE
ncbi:MAG: hypothetical protein HY902_15390 [Deltaproteobacteria bacterium]|nr:hypothetical protein [Deltaproteobacteria bacterium]